MRKKEFTSFDVAAVVRELKETVLDSRVSNVYQLDSKTLLFKLHKSGEANLRLVMEAGKRLHLTSYVTEKPLTPPAFCMALRKHLRNSQLISVEQFEFERVVLFNFKSRTGILRLVLELFGEGNIILVDENSVILHALSYRRMRDRNILRNEAFSFAPSSGKNPFKIGRTEFREELKRFGDVEIVRGLARLLSIGGVHAEEVLLRVSIDKTRHCDTLSIVEVDVIFDALQQLLSQMSKAFLEPCIVLDAEGEFVDVQPFKLQCYEGFKAKIFSSFNEALDEFYVKIRATEKAAATVNVEAEALKREAARLKRIIGDQEKALVEAEAKAEMYRRIGDAIYAHIGELQVLLDKFLTGKRSGKDWSQIISEVSADKNAGVEPFTFFESFDAKSLKVNVSLDGLRFSLELQRNLYESAGGFYDRSKSAKQKLEGAKAALAETRKKLVDVEAKIEEAEASEHVKPAEVASEIAKRRIKRKEWFEKFRWFVSSDGFLVVAGKDAVSNEVLIKKHADPNDLVFHADITGAPFVVVKTESRKPSEQSLQEAAEFAAVFSRGWREGFASVDVYWVKPEQLSKVGPSGEYVPHGAFTVSGKRNWMRNVPLKTAIGVVISDDGEVGFIGGPVDAVRSKTKIYVGVVPGDERGKELARKVLRSLAAKAQKEYGEKIVRASVEEVREYLPYVKGRAVER